MEYKNNGGCNNEYCYWNGFGSCCHESEEGHNNAVPNTLDCPTSLRKDFDEQFWILYEECLELLKHKYFAQLVEVRKLLLSQPPAPRIFDEEELPF